MIYKKRSAPERYEGFAQGQMNMQFMCKYAMG